VPAAPTAATIKGPLLRYRVMAFVVGVTLLLFCVAIVLKYVTKTIESDSVIAIVHGWLFMIYVLLGLDLGFRMRWSLGRLLLMTASGMIPFLSFYAEHQVSGWARAEVPGLGAATTGATAPDAAATDASAPDPGSPSH
jgi:integral membrane protein